MRLKFLFIAITISCMAMSCFFKKDTLFKTVDATSSGIDFMNKLEDKHLFNILYYLYYYNGAGVATGDLNNDGLVDIYFTSNSKGGNKLYINKGGFKFEDVTETAGVKGSSDWSSGVTMADINADGYLDIYVSVISGKYNLQGHNELFINNKNGTFSEKSESMGLAFKGLSTQAAFFDYDHDGDLDCYLLNQSSRPHSNIVDTANRRSYDSLSGDILFKNEVATIGKFKDVSKESGIYQSNLGYGLGLAVADLNNDGWEDIYVGNDFHENDYYYLNLGNGNFEEVGAKHFNHYSRFSMGNDIADYNNDGQLDVITVDMLPPDEKTVKTYGSDENLDIYKVKLEIQGYQNQYSRNCLQQNMGNGNHFSDVGLISGVSATDWSWSPLFADFDNDGYKDLFISSGIVKRPVDLDYVRYISSAESSNLDRTDAYDAKTIAAMPDGSSHPFFFKGGAKDGFKEVSAEWGTSKMKGYYNGAAYADLDNDGDLDIVINAINEKAVVLENKTTKKNHITLSFEGKQNTFGIGVKAYVFSGGNMQYQQLMLTRGFMSASSPLLHFGINEATAIDSIIIVWPSQMAQVIKNPTINSVLKCKELDANSLVDLQSLAPLPVPYFENVSANVNNKWKHIENEFVDFNVQYLLPHEQSTRGPKIAVGDVNADGLDDFYVCGAKFQSGALMIQQPGGTFVSSDTSLFKTDAICEDVDAVFFDANGDKSLDLLVISGGNEPRHNAFSLEDRLYLNNGKGKFVKSKNPFSQQYENKSCVTVADYDKDGDIDVFIGNLSSPTGYGIPQTSYLLVNDGSGKFSFAGQSIIPLKNIGMVTAAKFVDVNLDSWPDLVFTGEWMPIKIYINQKGKFVDNEIPSSTGLWQTLLPVDINKDGNIDLLAGNWGKNSKLYAGKTGPLKLYVKDFDKNGSNEQVMAYTIQGKEYTFLAKDELERALPVLKKAYLSYSEVAGKTVDYVFYDLFKDYTALQAENLASCYFINDGKGHFIKQELPNALQLSPLMSFVEVPDKLGKENLFIGAGNFYGVIPYEGRYDAMLPTVFNYNKSLKSIQIDLTFQDLNAEVRDMKWLRIGGNNKLLVVASNNNPLSFYKFIK